MKETGFSNHTVIECLEDLESKGIVELKTEERFTAAYLKSEYPHNFVSLNKWEQKRYIEKTYGIKVKHLDDPVELTDDFIRNELILA